MNGDLLLTGARLVTPDGLFSGWLYVHDGRIAQIGRETTPAPHVENVLNAQHLLLLPGLIDVHVHGALGCEAMDADPDALRTMAAFYAQHGVTGFLATTWTAPQAHILRALEIIAASVHTQTQQPYAGAKLLGAHLEGPYLNPSKCGAQDANSIRRAVREEALPLLQTDVIKLVTLAPEYTENHWFIEECVSRGITVSAGHTAATYAQICAAAKIGLTHATHTYNAMSGLHHREPGTLGAVMALPNIRCELIADLVHVHPAAIYLLWLAKGRDGIILITDAVRGAGLPEGTAYTQDGRQVIARDGAVYLPDDTLAGSTLTMNAALRNFMRAVDQPIEQVWQTSSLNAARALKLADHKGSLEVGKDADLILVDDDLNVYLTVVEGQIVHRKDI